MTGSETRSLERRTLYMLGAAVAAITFLVFVKALSGEFLNWDDPAYVTGNLFVRSFDGETLKSAFTSVVSSNWHPLTIISHAVDCAVWGLNPFGHHLTSVILHSINALLVFVLVVRLLGLASIKVNILFAAVLTALLFGVHPMRVESVAWVSERKDVLYGFFYLLSILSYIKFATSTSGDRFRHYAVSLLFFALSLLSKPMAVSLPIVLLLIDYYPLNRFSK
ncbi:MAG: hypothetical protein V3T30_08170, partial [Thermodesulfobacteriota bacterium]